MEIGGDVLKMWEVSLKETEEDMALAAKRKKIELPAQQSFVRDELDAKRPSLSAAESAGGVTEGPAQIFGEEGLSAQDVIRKLRTAAQQHGDDDQKKVAKPEEVSAGRCRASLPSVVTWNHVHLVDTSTSDTTKKRENEKESLVSGAVTEVSESAISPSGSSATLRLPSVITWTTPHRTTSRHTPSTEEGTREEEERTRMEERRASEEIALANLNTLKAHLGQAKGLINELKDRRADAEAQLSEMEEELSKQQRAANMRRVPSLPLSLSLSLSLSHSPSLSIYLSFSRCLSLARSLALSLSLSLSLLLSHSLSLSLFLSLPLSCGGPHLIHTNLKKLST
jgi:hypothetical protein